MLVRVLALAVLFLPAHVLAAKVSPLFGEVRVNSGQGFQLIETPTEVAPGTQIMVSPEGSASITYADDCEVAAAPSTITIVEDQPQCFDFPEPMHFSPAVEGDEEEEEVTAKRRRRPKSQEPKDRCVWDDHMLIVGGLVVGGGIAAAVALSGDNPTSP